MEQLQYVNRFRFAANNQGEEAQLTFYQAQPIWNEEGSSITDVTMIEISRLFMTTETARNLQKVLNECLSGDILEESATQE